ncbi:MAG: hypothetical protein WCL32_10395, partial [Planctomycetota bacterium]
MAAIKDALDSTTRTIDLRARDFRNLVVLVSIVGVAALVWAGIAWSAEPLLGLLLLFPICGGFVVLDCFRVDRWRGKILRLWIEEDLDLGAFSSMIGSIKMLPANTMGAMLRSLPTGGHPLAGIGQSREFKMAVASTIAVRHRIEGERTLVAVLAYSAIVASVAGAILIRDGV